MHSYQFITERHSLHDIKPKLPGPHNQAGIVCCNILIWYPIHIIHAHQHTHALSPGFPCTPYTHTPTHMYVHTQSFIPSFFSRPPPPPSLSHISEPPVLQHKRREKGPAIQQGTQPLTGHLHPHTHPPTVHIPVAGHITQAPPAEQHGEVRRGQRVS